MVEHFIRNEGVGGSIPFTSSRKKGNRTVAVSHSLTEESLQFYSPFFTARQQHTPSGA